MHLPHSSKLHSSSRGTRTQRAWKMLEKFEKQNHVLKSNTFFSFFFFCNIYILFWVQPREVLC